MAQGTAVAESRRVGDAEVVTVGIDVSDRYSHLCSLGDDGEILREERVRTTTAALTRALAPLQDARVVLEVGPRSPWLSRMFSELGHDVIVANPRQVALIARSRRKTDRSDAEHLARLGRFDPKLLFPIRHRGATAQADLQVLRSRDALVRARTALINHVRGAVKAWARRSRAARRRPSTARSRRTSRKSYARRCCRCCGRSSTSPGRSAGPTRRSPRCASATRRPPRCGRSWASARSPHSPSSSPSRTRPASPRTGRWGPTWGWCRGAAIPVTGSPSCGSRRRGTRRCAGC